MSGSQMLASAAAKDCRHLQGTVHTAGADLPAGPGVQSLHEDPAGWVALDPSLPPTSSTGGGLWAPLGWGTESLLGAKLGWLSLPSQECRRMRSAQGGIAGRPGVSPQSTTTVRRQALGLHSQAVQTPPAIHTPPPPQEAAQTWAGHRGSRGSHGHPCCCGSCHKLSLACHHGET